MLKSKIINKILLFAGLILYFFSILTSAFHIYHVYSFFETEEYKFVALFITLSLEISILFISYVFYTNRFLKIAKNYILFLRISLFIILIYIWFLNYIYMEYNFTEKIILFNSIDISFIFPLIASFFLPFSALALSIAIIILYDKERIFYKNK